MIRKKRLTERGGEWVEYLFYYRVVCRGRPQEDKLSSYGVWAGKGIGWKGEKGRLINCPFEELRAS